MVSEPSNPNHDQPTRLPHSPDTAGPDAQTGFVNDSGTGRTAMLPTELRGFNWGAFFCPWAWALTNKTYIGLIAFLPLIMGATDMKTGSIATLGWSLILVPFISLTTSIALGLKGSEMAWQNRQWESIGDFKAVQTKLVRVDLILLLASLALQVFFIGNISIRS
jgi:hypothetical protein